MNKYQAMSQRSAKDNLGNPDMFKGGAIITRNGHAELFIQTAKERENEERLMHEQQQAIALVKLAVMAKQDVENGDTYTPEEALIVLGISES